MSEVILTILKAYLGANLGSYMFRSMIFGIDEFCKDRTKAYFYLPFPFNSIYDFYMSRKKCKVKKYGGEKNDR